MRIPARHPFLPARIGACLAALCALVPAASTSADWLIETRISGSDAVEHPGRIYLDGSNLRIEVDDKPPTRVIFLGSGPEMQVLDDERRKVAVLDGATLKHLSQQMSAAQKAVEARMASLPPEQRAALEAMMPKPSAPPAPLSLEKTDRTRDLDGHTCRVRELRRGSEPAGEICVISWKEAGIDRSDLRAFRDLGKFQSEMTAGVAGPWTRKLSSQPYEVFDQLDGYPIATQQVRGEKVVATGHLALPRKVPGDEGRYQAPEDWPHVAIGPPTSP